MFFTGDNFSGSVTFVNTFVCQHRLTDDIADSKDAVRWYAAVCQRG